MDDQVAFHIEVGMYIDCPRQLSGSFRNFSNFDSKATTAFQPHLTSRTGKRVLCPLVVVNYITPRYKPVIIPAVDYYLAHISRVSVWFQSKERPR